jgi:predicted transcriptional regulator
MDSQTSSWKEIFLHHIIDRREDGNQTLRNIVDRQNLKVSCLEIFNEKNLEYDNIDKCINKLYQSSLILKDVNNRITKY